ncbi:hypothetical protein MRX96_034150 [Rhipicephalus microplus]
MAALGLLDVVAIDPAIESPSLVGDVHADSALSTSKLGRQYVALDSDCMSVKSEHNLTNALIQNNCRAPMASLECLDEGTLSSGSSVLASQPPTRQVSTFAPPAVRYRNLGKSGLRISNVGLGTWVTFGSLISEEVAEDIVTAAFDNGINVFDTADIYAGGKAEVALGKVLKKKRWRRSSYVITTKLFWATKSDSERGLSRKAIIEGLQASLERLQLSYVDIMLINKADSMCPMEEIVRACTYCIDQGMAMYWGTSRWSAVEIMEAYTVARQCHLLPELCQKIGIGTMSWSPQAFGVLTGKFDEGVNLLSRGSFRQYVSAVTDKVDRPEKAICEESGGRFTRQHSKLQELSYIADRLGCSCNQLTIAWCLKSEHVHTVLVGASSVDQLYDHLGALQVVPKLTSTVMGEIEKVLDNRPRPVPPPR